MNTSTHVLRGIACPYGVLSQNDGAVFVPGCFSDFLAGQGEVFLAVRHDESWRLARRSDGTLRFTDSPEALRFEADLSGFHDGAIANRIMGLVGRGILRGASVGADYCLSDTERDRFGRVTIRQASLVEVSLVEAGAIPGTRVEAVPMSSELRAALIEMGRAQFKGFATPSQVRALEAIAMRTAT